MAALVPSPHTLHRRIKLFATIAVAIALAATGYHFLWRQHVKRFQVIRPGVLYRVAQPSELGMRYLVDRHHVKTVLNLRLEDDHLRRGVLAVGAPTGDLESRFVAELGVRSLQWGMGREACWPWVSPWQFDEFYRLFDNSDNFPIAIHCVSGRHRTGTIAALFRLEYDRWPIERVLAEMYSFSFGPPIPLQEMNLRTYVPRPLPNDDEWQSLRNTWAPCLKDDLVPDYTALVQHLRAHIDQSLVHRILDEQLARGAPFALPLAERLIDTAENPSAPAALAAAKACVGKVTSADATAEQPAYVDLMSAASLVADLGTAEDQEQLVAQLRQSPHEPPASATFQALAAGVANRYTGNRIPFLAALLDETRVMPGTGSVTVRYCDMAVAHLSAILDQRLINVGSTPTPADWEQARQQAKNWLQAHPQMMQARRIEQPATPTLVR
jgi:hypothetical protein